MSAMQYERVLSLGGVCQTTYRIKQRFGFNLSSPFDWLVTPLSALKTILRDDGSQLGLDVHYDPERLTTVCDKYSVAYQHEFVRDEQARPIITEDSLASCRRKLIHKYDKMTRLLQENRPTLFIRMLGHHDELRLTPNVRDPRPVRSEDLNELVEVIEEKYPELPFELAFVYFGNYTEIETRGLGRRIRLFPLEETTGDWIGDEAEWSKVFDTYAFDIAGAERAEGEHLM